jgi:hypothetical protein
MTLVEPSPPIANWNGEARRRPTLPSNSTSTLRASATPPRLCTARISLATSDVSGTVGRCATGRSSEPICWRTSARSSIPFGLKSAALKPGCGRTRRLVYAALENLANLFALVEPNPAISFFLSRGVLDCWMNRTNDSSQSTARPCPYLRPANGLATGGRNLLHCSRSTHLLLRARAGGAAYFVLQTGGQSPRPRSV